MNVFWTSVAPVTLAYLIGSLSFAVLVSRAMGLSDPRTYGSGNPGATNVLRSGHQGAAALTLVLDVLKGYVPVLCVALWGDRWGWGAGTLAGVALAVFLGHLWPVFFGFKGGKGVATAAGVLLALSPWLGLATLATWVIMALFFRYSSLAALTASAFAVFYQCLMAGLTTITLAVGVMALLLVWRHRTNIQNLCNGTETKLGQKPLS